MRVAGCDWPRAETLKAARSTRDLMKGIRSWRIVAELTHRDAGDPRACIFLERQMKDAEERRAQRNESLQTAARLDERF